MARELQIVRPVTRPNRAKAARGFTLVELMIVVAIIAVLAVLAVVGYRKLVLSAHTSEATNMVQAIRTAQEAYHAETQTYVSTSGTLVYPGATLYPNAAPNNMKTGWGGGIAGVCPALPGNSINCWSVLPLHVDSAVMFGYATVGGQAGNLGFPGLQPIYGNPITLPLQAPMDWYFILAIGNVDNTGVLSAVVGTSFTNDLFVQDSQ
jgi:type IV pilus assembly protein PilA